MIFSFGAAAYAPSSVLGARSRALGWQREKAPEKPAIGNALSRRSIRFSKAIPLSPGEVLARAPG